MKRNRSVYLIAAAVVVVSGLASRRYAGAIPGFVASYGGDTLWALAAFLGFGLLFPKMSTVRTGIFALLFACAIELSQLYHAPWIDCLRRTKIGGLILGYGFLWSDLLCYAVGVAAGCVLELLLMRALHGGRRPSGF